MRIVLASASPRRREILARIAWPFEVRPADLDESRRDGEAPHDYVARLAREKSVAIAVDATDALVVGADTAVVVGDRVLGKPSDPEDAAAMLASLSGRRHRVLSGVAIARAGEVARSWVTSSEVEFRVVGDEEIRRYVESGESLDKAGGYAVQGGAAGFVSRVHGSVTSVIGLPLEETRAAMRELGGPVHPEAAVEAVPYRLRSVQGEIAARAVALGSAPDSVRLLTVTKGHPFELAAAAIAAGAGDVGENYVQEAQAKREVVGDAGVRWHLIGPLQRNKARVAARVFDVVQTVERRETAEALARRVPQGTGRLEVLLQVNVARDPAKGGVLPEEAGDLLAYVADLTPLRVTGLMTIGHADAGRERAVATFAELRELRDRLRGSGHEDLVELSMGMSDDYDVAIEQGATLVRLGTAILGRRPPRRQEA